MLFSKENMVLAGITILEITTLSLMKTDTHVAIILVLYAILGYGLRNLIRSKGLISGNATYDFLGIIGSSIVAVVYFGEKMTPHRIGGLLLGLGSLYLLNM